MKKLMLIAMLATSVIAKAQSPQLTVKDKDSVLVKMSQMIVQVKIVGNIAYTTAEMHFTNASSRQMEAELLFPLPEGVSVSKFAIDINGKMREAVPVNKSKGKQVFEAVEHRRVDPGLLEKVEGNNFKTRIYPIMPNGERVVLIGYEQELSFVDKTNLQYQLLAKYPYKLDKFEVNISVIGATDNPTATNDNVETLSWSASNQTSIKKTNYTPAESWIIKIPIAQNSATTLMQTVNEQHFFYSNLFVESKKILKPTPASIGIIWDNSLSCKTKNIKKEVELLDAYFKEVKNTTVTLYLLNYFFTKDEVFDIKNGNWDLLKTKLVNTVYDGGTRFSQIDVAVQDEYLFFTDGLSTLSESNFKIYKKPVYTITSATSANFAYLNINAQKTGANFINLNEVNVEKATEKLLYQSLRFLGIKDNNVASEIYPTIGTAVNGSFSIAGIATKTVAEITLLFGYNNTPTIEQKIMLDADKQSNETVSIEKLWAQKKITNLEYDYNKNIEEIETMGKEYGIVTQGTSLIVLENINDYITYDIIPPLELRAEFDRIKKQQTNASIATQKSNWQNIESYFNGLYDWWKKDIKQKQIIPIALKKGKNFSVSKNSPNAPAIQQVTIANGNSGYANNYSTTQAETRFAAPSGAKNIEVSTSIGADKALQGKVAGMQVTAAQNGLSTATYKSLRKDAVVEKDDNKNEEEEPRFDSTRFNIKTNAWSPDRNYLKILSASTNEKKYSTYLALREKDWNNPNFYFDVANYFYDRGDKEKALLILSNIADLGSENHQLYKTLSYTLRQWQAHDDAVYAAKQIAIWRIHEPQSHRDYALALEENKQYQAAFDECIKALEVNYFGEMTGQYAGVEDIILMDINRMIAEHPIVKTDKLDKKYLKKMPVAVRVILNWNQMDVDIDMHIIEPNIEECYYAHKTTAAGARFSKDFTQGYGPEQYLLRNAIKGKYLIKSNFYGESTLTENGPATLLVEIYITKADGSIEKKLKTIQAGKVKENGVLAEVVID